MSIVGELEHLITRPPPATPAPTKTQANRAFRDFSASPREKPLSGLGHPVALAISVSQVKDVETVNVLLRLHSLNDESLPDDISMKLLDEQGQPEYFADDANEIIESCSNGQTKVVYLPFKYPKGECFIVETTRGEIKICERFFV